MNRLFKFLSILPLPLLQCAGWVLGWLVFLLSATYRKRFMAHARLAGVRGSARSAAVGAAGQVVAELPRLWFGRPVPAVIEGATYIDQAIARGRGVIFLTPHLGCFEITAQAYAARYGVAGWPMTVLYRPARQTWLRSLIASSRERPGMLAAPTTLAGVKQMLKALKQGHCVGLLPDQVPPLGQGVWAPFFGQAAYTMTLSSRLAMQTGATVLLAWGQRLSWGRGYVVHVQPFTGAVSDDMQDAAAQMNRAMETLVRQAPAQYLWGYARYKQPREG